MKPDNDNLDTLYRQSSERYKTPSRVRRQVLAAMGNKPKLSLGNLTKTWLPLMGAAVAALFIVVVINVDKYNNDNSAQYALVEVEHHGFDKKSSQDGQYAKTKERFLKEYQQKERSLIVATKRLATVEILDAQWQLRDCNNNLIQLSQQLVAQLQNESRVSNNLAIGSHVELALNNNGLILSIERDNHAMC